MGKYYDKSVGEAEDEPIDLPPLGPNDEPLGQRFFTTPEARVESTDPELKPYVLEENSGIKFLIPWIIMAVFTIIGWAIFQFGLLGDKGVQGPLCRYLPANKTCQFLAGTPPSLSK